MNITPKFEKTLLGSKQSKVSTDYWEQVLKLHKEGKYRAAVMGILSYVRPDLVTDTEQTSFSVPHGSAIVNLEITDTHFKVNAPFLKVPEGGSVPMLRQVAQINFSPLDMAQIKLNGNLLSFHFESHLELCEPYKIYEVLREICQYADQYDDLFIDNFGAEWLHEPVVQQFPKEKLDQVWTTVQAFIKEALEYVNHYEQHRMPIFAQDIISITLKKIEYYIAPQGILRTKLEDSVKNMESNIPVTDRINKGRIFLKELQSYNREEFDKDIYMIDVFIPYKFNSSMDNIKANFELAHKTAKSEMDKNDYIGATLTLQYAFFNLFYYNDVRDNLSDFVSDALAKTSNVPWNEASQELYKTMTAIMTDKVPDPKAKKKGFWASLFGK